MGVPGIEYIIPALVVGDVPSPPRREWAGVRDAELGAIDDGDLLTKQSEPTIHICVMQQIAALRRTNMGQLGIAEPT